MSHDDLVACIERLPLSAEERVGMALTLPVVIESAAKKVGQTRAQMTALAVLNPELRKYLFEVALEVHRSEAGQEVFLEFMASRKSA